MYSKQYRFLKSARTERNPFLSTAECLSWLLERQRLNRFEVKSIPFAAMQQWSFEPQTGNLVHETGKFFSIEGIHVTTNYGPVSEWSQPIINQPEVGILGILVKEFDGVLYCLMQAKMEPGNIHMVQLAPTVQATKSNYTQVHQGSKTRYIEYFVDRSRAKVLVDVLQSEQGARFLRKRNRNMIIEVTEDLDVHQDFCWVSIGQLHKLLRHDNVVNMDARTVLACIPFLCPEINQLSETIDAAATSEQRFNQLLLQSIISDQSVYSIDDILSWFTNLKTYYDLIVTPIPLAEVQRWHRGRSRIFHETRQFFTVLAVAVTATNREVFHWHQPIVKPRHKGIVCFLTKQINGVLHFLVQAKVEPGNFDILEMAPTVQCITGSYQFKKPPFLEYVLNVHSKQVRFSTYQSEEGGRFYQEQNKNMIIEVEADFPLTVPDNYMWMTLNQMKELIRYNNYFNVEARSLISCLSFL